MSITLSESPTIDPHHPMNRSQTYRILYERDPDYLLDRLARKHANNAEGARRLLDAINPVDVIDERNREDEVGTMMVGDRFE